MSVGRLPCLPFELDGQGDCDDEGGGGDDELGAVGEELEEGVAAVHWPWLWPARLVNLYCRRCRFLPVVPADRCFQVGWRLVPVRWFGHSATVGVAAPDCHCHWQSQSQSQRQRLETCNTAATAVGEAYQFEGLCFE